MLSTLRVVAPPASPAVPLAVVKQHVRVDNSGDDPLLAFYVESATQTVEAYLARALISQTLAWTVQETPPGNVPLVPAGNLLVLPLAFSGAVFTGRALELPRSPVQQVLGVRMGAGSDARDVAADRYALDLGQDPARLRLLGGLSLYGGAGGYGYGTQGFSVTFRAGYGDTPEAIPAPIRHSIMLLCGSLYENRGDTADGGEMPAVVSRLLAPWRVPVFA